MATEYVPDYSCVARELVMVRQCLLEALASDEPLVNDVTAYFLRGGGKQLRPALVLLAGKCHGGTGEKAISVAAALELLHMASLVHDDVVDEALTRRGVPSVNACWGNRVAVLLGDFFYARALRLSARCGNEVVQGVAGLIDDLVRGEFRQLASAYRMNCGEEGYLDRIHLKTARFISTCCRLGAAVEGAAPEICDRLADYGRNLGILYQITDDILDLTGSLEETGKTVGSDLAQGIFTLPAIYAWQQGQRHPALEQIITTGRAAPGDIVTVSRWLAEIGMIDYAYKRAAQYKDRALSQLDGLPPGPARDALAQVVEFCFTRRS